MSVIATAGLITNASAHDFWLGLDEYSIEKGAVEINFLVGHAADQAPWPITHARVVSFQTNENGAVRDLSGFIDPEEKIASVSFENPGLQIIAFESTPSRIELNAENFNSYLAEEGLAAVMQHRAAAKTENEPGVELYSRRAKAIIAVGRSKAGDVTSPRGQTLEIVPEKNPLTLSKNEELPVRVYFRGEPLRGASVHLESLSIELVPEVTRITDDEGRAFFAIPKTGAWKFDTVWSTPVSSAQSAENNVDYETVFSSLTFGY